jgi:hypothetical protein
VRSEDGAPTADDRREADLFCRRPVHVFCGMIAVQDGGSRADRAIRTGQLSALPHVHTRPIDVMVYHGPRGDLVSRWVSRLDAFSGYPVRT